PLAGSCRFDVYMTAALPSRIEDSGSTSQVCVDYAVSDSGSQDRIPSPDNPNLNWMRHPACLAPVVESRAAVNQPLPLQVFQQARLHVGVVQVCWQDIDACRDILCRFPPLRP